MTQVLLVCPASLQTHHILNFFEFLHTTITVNPLLSFLVLGGGSLIGNLEFGLSVKNKRGREGGLKRQVGA